MVFFENIFLIYIRCENIVCYYTSNKSQNADPIPAMDMPDMVTRKVTKALSFCEPSIAEERLELSEANNASPAITAMSSAGSAEKIEGIVAPKIPNKR